VVDVATWRWQCDCGQALATHLFPP
jgi:hypothetical protein